MEDNFLLYGFSIINPIGIYDYPEDDEPDVDPYLGIMPSHPNIDERNSVRIIDEELLEY